MRQVKQKNDLCANIKELRDAAPVHQIRSYEDQIFSGASMMMVFCPLQHHFFCVS